MVKPLLKLDPNLCSRVLPLGRKLHGDFEIFLVFDDCDCLRLTHRATHLHGQIVRQPRDGGFRHIARVASEFGRALLELGQHAVLEALCARGAERAMGR